MGTVTINVKTNRLGTDFTKSGQPRHNINRCIKLLEGLNGGHILGSVDIQSSTSDPAAATTVATLTYASLANNDTITILGVVLTCVTGTPTTDQWKKQTDATTSAVNLKTAINANATLAKYVTATSSAGVVTITCNLKGAIGNYLTVVTKSSSGIALVDWANGTGGPATAGTSIGR
jgi:hypothetical protein